ncbi:MAG: AAA family ATPase [Desulfobacterales bacterium]|jgi:DNA transposition AAA+ family ATPase|nr:AAA family ATPase [Desulfobacterales bacterium]
MTEVLSTKDKVKRLMDEQSVSQNQIARESGISASAISGYLKGSYAGDTSSVEDKLEKWLLSSQKRAQQKRSFLPIPEWISLPTSERVLEVLQYAHHAGDIGVIYGASGVGKTYTLKHYEEKNPNVWVCVMTPAHAGVSPCLEEIAFALDMKGVSGRSARLLREIIRRVRDTNGLLVIDEAQHLLPSAIEVIRSIHDATGIGVVLCGNESVYARLTGGARTATFAQLFSRIGKRLKIIKPVKGDIFGIAGAFGVENGKAQQAVLEIGRKPGGLRGVVKTLRLAVVISAGAGREIDESIIKAAWCDLSGDAGDNAGRHNGGGV